MNQDQSPHDDTKPWADAAPLIASTPMPIIGIGASAGGVAALQQFFSRLPADTGMAFVVVLHLSPDYESNLDSVLQRASPIPVQQVTDMVLVEPNMVYVIPPIKQLTMQDGHLRLSDFTDDQGRRAPINLFFRTLAETHGHEAAAIVLSGTGADGASGAQRVKENGGFVLAQDPAEAEYDAMPRNVIATGLVDLVLPVEEMPERLIAYWRNAEQILLPVGEATLRDTNNDALREIFAMLRSRTGHDFSQYKRPTLLRRIGRRMQVASVTSLPAYLGVLRSRPKEVQALLRDLLISVTNFFRDRDAWQALAMIVPRLFAGKHGDDFVRVWVAACATGEEAYSIAIQLYEFSLTLEQPPTIQVFATDIDDEAIVVARQGYYLDTIAADVSAERLQRFFSPDHGGYRIRKEIRELVLFAPHNVLRDPPFSRLDLVICRNLLIYLNREVQEQILQLFHFTLRADGYLLLGASESTDIVPGLFGPIDKIQRLFQRRTVPASAPAKLPALPLVGPRQPRIVRSQGDSVSPSFANLDQQLLAQYSPPGVIVSEDYEIVHLARGAGQFFQLVDGEPSHNLLKVIHPDLQFELRAALFMAAQLGKQTETRRVRVEVDGINRQVYLVVQPLQEPEWARGYLLVVFHDASDSDDLTRYVSADTAPIMHQIEEKLLRTKNQLRTTIEQYETMVEEHRAGNEELQAINEELRAASEELETSKEELQSINEEMTAVNQELKHKIEELSNANNDLHNLMVSTEIATIFVDRELRLKRYTPSALAIFNLIPADMNRPLNHITHRLQYDQMVDDTIQVIETLTQGEREVASSDNHWYLARLRAYRTDEDRVDGVVLTFVDITKRKQAEDALRASEERLRLLIESVQDYAIFGIDTNGQINSWNSGAERTFGYSENEVIGQHTRLIFTPEDQANRVPEREMQQALTEGRAEDERWHMRRGGERFFVSGVMTQAGGDARYGFVKVLRNLTDRKHAEAELLQAHTELEQKVNERTSELADSNVALQTEIVQRTHAEHARQEVLRQLVTAQEEERRRISRELHDQLGQQLSALRVGLAALHNQAMAGELAAKLADIQQLAEQIDNDVDRLALDLRPSALDDLGLLSALQQYVEEWSALYGMTVDMQIIDTTPIAFPSEVEIVLYRVVQEALNNVVKHAMARSVSLILELRADHIQLIVEDDGQGFDQETERDNPMSSRLGLIGMQERVALVGGTLAVESQPGNGTTVFVRIPLQAQPKD